MSVAQVLLPTSVPGLYLTPGHREVVHAASGLSVLTLPEGLSPQEARGPRDTSRGFTITATVIGALDALGTEDWTGPMNARQQGRLNDLQGAYADAASVRALMARLTRIEAAIRRSHSDFWYSERGRQITAATETLNTARAARQSASNSAEKAWATRLEGRARQAISECAMTEAKIDCLLHRPRGPRARLCLHIARMNARGEHLRALEKDRRERVERGHAVRRLFWSAQRAAGSRLYRELRTCEQMPGLDVTTLQGWAHPQRKGHSSYYAANLRRVSRAQQQLPLDPGHAEVRALTRATRIEAGRTVLRRSWGFRGRWALYVKHTLALGRAWAYKGKDVRARRLAQALSDFGHDFHTQSGQHAALRGILNALNVPGPQRGEWPPCPKWQPQAEPPPRPPVRSQQPSLFA